MGDPTVVWPFGRTATVRHDSECEGGAAHHDATLGDAMRGHAWHRRNATFPRAHRALVSQPRECAGVVLVVATVRAGNRAYKPVCWIGSHTGLPQAARSAGPPPRVSCVLTITIAPAGASATSRPAEVPSWARDAASAGCGL